MALMLGHEWYLYYYYYGNADVCVYAELLVRAVA